MLLSIRAAVLAALLSCMRARIVNGWKGNAVMSMRATIKSTAVTSHARVFLLGCYYYRCRLLSATFYWCRIVAPLFYWCRIVAPLSMVLAHHS